jgi:hypothetical protein
MASNGSGVPVQNEKVNTDIVTLTRFLTEEQAKHKEASGDFTYESIALLPSPNLKLTRLQITLPCPPILLQVDCILHPTGDPDQPYRPRRLKQHHRRRPKETRCHWQ